MSEQKEIWPSETGILDLPANWKDMRVEELNSVRDAWKTERERLKSSNQLDQFVDQLKREWAIETGIIENIYEIDRGVTKTLIEQGFQAAFLETGTTNKPRDWVIQLLKDQQDALEGLFVFITQKRTLSNSYIKQLHDVMLHSQTHADGIDPNGNYIKIELIRGDWKKHPNYPTKNEVTYRYCPPEQVASEMDRLICMHTQHVNSAVPPEIEAAWLHHRFSQIHPFQDGNGRIARTLASLVFIQKNLFPLVVTRDEKVEYLKALEAADEGDLGQLVNLFARLQRVRYRMAVSTSENTQRASVTQALEGLRASVSKRIEEQKAQLNRVFDFARIIEARTFERLNDIAPELGSLLRQLEPTSHAYADRSTSETDHYFRGQIIEIARDHLNYYANPTPYKSWVRLKMKWIRRANLVFTVHAIGHEFSGVLVCAPFLEFLDPDDEDNGNGSQRTLTSVASEPFEFFYNEQQANVEKRFGFWLETVLTVALAELQSSL